MQQEKDKRIELKNMSEDNDNSSGKNNVPPIPEFRPKKTNLSQFFTAAPACNSSVVSAKRQEQSGDSYLNQLAKKLEQSEDSMLRSWHTATEEGIKKAVLKIGHTIETFFFKLLITKSVWSYEFRTLVAETIITRCDSFNLGLTIKLDDGYNPFFNKNTALTAIAILAKHQSFEALEWVLDNRKPQNPSRDELESYRIALYLTARISYSPNTLIKKLMDCLIDNDVSLTLSKEGFCPTILHYLIMRDNFEKRKFRQFEPLAANALMGSEATKLTPLMESIVEPEFADDSLITTAIKHVEPSEILRFDGSFVALRLAVKHKRWDLALMMFNRLPAQIAEPLIPSILSGSLRDFLTVLRQLPPILNQEQHKLDNETTSRPVLRQ